MAFESPPSVPFEDWTKAAKRAVPVVGIIIITWGACEAHMNTQTHRVRMDQNPTGGWPRLSHKFKERLNEWIRLCLSTTTVCDDIEALRADMLRLQTIRNNLAHNIDAIWIDTSNELRIFCTVDNKEYEAEDAAFDYSQGLEHAPWPIKAITYAGDDLIAAHNEMRTYLKLIGSVQEPRGMPFPRS